jgi:hypothetical protein
VQFKFETTDNDYHLVITDDTLNFTPGRPGSSPSGHSFIAEIPDPNCIAGAHGNPSAHSAFIAGIQNARRELQAQFPNLDQSGAFNDAGGIAVQIMGIGFFDPPHDQTGRAPNNIEIHPVLDITFNPSVGTLALSASPAALTVPQGGTIATTISTVAGAGLNSPIALSTSALPTGATATFNTAFIPAPGSGTSTLTITPGASTPLGNFKVTVNGSGGSVSSSTSIDVSVIPATSLPATVVSSPADGASVSGTVNVAATASDGMGITKLEIYIDGALKACNFSALSISYPWDTTAVSSGSHTINSKAYNAAGAIGTSSSVTVTVAN